MSKTWNSVEWLVQNYQSENGLPGFFFAGDYNSSCRAVAEADYVDTVKRCMNSKDIDVQAWAIRMAQSDYRCLKQVSVTDYWLSHTLHANVIDTIYTYELQKNEASSDKRAGMTTRAGTSSTKRARIIVAEEDDVLTAELGKSLGTIIKSEAVNMGADQHHGYFKCAGMNNILDATDVSHGSQLALFNDNQRDLILAKIRSTPVEYEPALNEELHKLAEAAQSSSNRKRMLSQMYAYAVKAKTENQISAQIYIHVFQLLLWSPNLFDIKTLGNLSEGDYVVKFWGPLVELTFAKSNLIPQWGDTVSQLGKKKKPRMKMDLRILCAASNNDSEQDDVANGEFARSAGRCKYYKDKMKLVIHGKLLLNEGLKELGCDSSGKTRICMLQCMGLEAELYSLRLFANGLYVLESHGTLRIPTNFQDYAEWMKVMMDKLSLFKQLSSNMKDHCELVRASKYQQKTTFTRFTGLDKDASPGTNWIRAIWNPPSLRKEYDDDDDDE